MRKKKLLAKCEKKSHKMDWDNKIWKLIS